MNSWAFTKGPPSLNFNNKYFIGIHRKIFFSQISVKSHHEAAVRGPPILNFNIILQSSNNFVNITMIEQLDFFEGGGKGGTNF